MPKESDEMFYKRMHKIMHTADEDSTEDFIINADCTIGIKKDKDTGDVFVPRAKEKIFSDDYDRYEQLKRKFKERKK